MTDMAHLPVDAFVPFTFYFNVGEIVPLQLGRDEPEVRGIVVGQGPDGCAVVRLLGELTCHAVPNTRVNPVSAGRQADLDGTT